MVDPGDDSRSAGGPRHGGEPDLGLLRNRHADRVGMRMEEILEGAAEVAEQLERDAAARAEAIVAAAEREAAELKKAAAAEAQRIRAEAETEAGGVVAAAERRRAEIEAEAQAISERGNAVLSGIGEVARDLERLMGEMRPGDLPTGPAAAADGA